MKKRMAMYMLASTVAFAGLAGAGTYAYFSDTETSEGNKVQAGTLEMTGFRNDIPIEGPMFYTYDGFGPDDAGVLGTGLWQPGDTHTRGMFIRNDGTLNAKLNKLYAEAENADAEAFAEQAHVTIAVFEPDSNVFLNIDSSEYADLVDAIDQFYKTTFDDLMESLFPNHDQMELEELKEAIKQVHGEVKKLLMEESFRVDVDGDPVNVDVRHVFQDQLSEFVGNGEVVVPDLQYVVEPGESLFFGYTVSFDDLTPEENNPLQGKEVKFNFATEFVQE
jgi:spore coat-associated protein N